MYFKCSERSREKCFPNVLFDFVRFASTKRTKALKKTSTPRKRRKRKTTWLEYLFGAFWTSLRIVSRGLIWLLTWVVGLFFLSGIWGLGTYIIFESLGGCAGLAWFVAASVWWACFSSKLEMEGEKLKEGKLSINDYNLSCFKHFLACVLVACSLFLILWCIFCCFWCLAGSPLCGYFLGNEELFTTTLQRFMGYIKKG